jgi:hypothetical protein
MIARAWTLSRLDYYPLWLGLDAPFASRIVHSSFIKYSSSFIGQCIRNCLSKILKMGAQCC